MKEKVKINLVWLRRDLRLYDNMALYHALKHKANVQLIFIFDSYILSDLEADDKRLNFIYQVLVKIQKSLAKYNASLCIKKGKPLEVFKNLSEKYTIENIYCNHDYEPYALKRDETVKEFAKSHDIGFHSFKDQVIFEKNDIVKPDGLAYTVFTPYAKKWLKQLAQTPIKSVNCTPLFSNLYKSNDFDFPEAQSIGIKKASFNYPEPVLNKDVIKNYNLFRDYPAMEGTSRLGIHFRFGSISIREAVIFAQKHSPVWLNELIWREFFMMILFHYPYVVDQPFKKKYNKLPWLYDDILFEKWTKGETGYPLVDAGMRELVATGFMHNRVRMVTASFLTKHLLHDWRLGEAFFAKHLLDYELSSNNGNWQWAAGTGCDAMPYFRIFNPMQQAKKFDKKHTYISKWVPEFNSNTYAKAVIEHKYARERAIKTFTSIQ